MINRSAAGQALGGKWGAQGLQTSQSEEGGGGEIDRGSRTCRDM